MEKERKNGSGHQKNRKQKGGRSFSAVYRRILRLFRRHRKTALAASACALAVCCMLLVVWALMKGLSDQNIEAEMETVRDVAGEPMDTEEPLLENAWPEVNDLISRYFAAMQEDDEETLTALRDYTGTAELLRIRENSSHIEAYTDISCFTKSGLEEGSYVVFARYEVKFEGIDTTLPGIAPLYVCENGDGTCYLHDLSQDEAAAAYAAEVAAQEDVTRLYAQVNEEYEARLAQDETLAAYVESYQSDMMVAVGEALEEQTAQETEEQEDEAAETKTQETAETPKEADAAGSGASDQDAGSSSSVPNSGPFTVSETVNIRKGVSETSDKIAVCYPGETLEILMKQADGWTRVEYQGQVGYVKSDVLK